MKKLLISFFLFFLTSPAWATTFWVRTDGGAYGTTSTTCNGQYDVAYTAGNGPNCAVSHPSYLLGSGYSTSPGEHSSGIMSAGDIGIVKSGSYAINYLMPGNVSCSESWTYQCELMPPPNGSVGNVTKLIGCSATGCSSESDRPQFYLQGRLNHVMNLSSSSYIEISDIEITDHYGADAECSYGLPLQECGRSVFYANAGGTWSNLTFTRLDIHGLTGSAFGKFAGGGYTHDVGTWLIQDSNLDGNQFAGIDMDDCSNNGTCGIIGNISFDNVNMRWNGCAEAYPVVWGTDGTNGVDGRLPTAGSCREGNNGGYGDMLGTSDTGGDWSFTDCNFSHNTSDSIDLLYCGRTDRQNYGTCSVSVKRTLFEGNNGQAIKGPNPTIEDNLIIGNCSFWGENTEGYAAASFASCRAQGTPISIQFRNSSAASIVNNTILGEGDVIFGYEGTECTLNVYNNILIGGYQYCQDAVAMYYTESCGTTNDVNEDYNLSWQSFKDGYTIMSGANDKASTDPVFSGSVYTGTTSYTCSGNRYTGTVYYQNLDIGVTSPCIDSADETVSGADSLDYNSFSRGASWDIGALEYGSEPASETSPLNVFRGTWRF